MKKLCKASLVAGLGLLLFFASPVTAQAVEIPNASFEQGEDAPAGWQAGGDGKTGWATIGHTGKRSLVVSDCKEQSSVYWRCKTLRLVRNSIGRRQDYLTGQPSRPYRLSFWSRAEGAGQGCIISGLNEANRDFSYSPTWKEYSCGWASGTARAAFSSTT